jgi:hypothetical protein
MVEHWLSKHETMIFKSERYLISYEVNTPLFLHSLQPYFCVIHTVIAVYGFLMLCQIRYFLHKFV